MPLYVAKARGTVDRRSAGQFPQSIAAFQRRTVELNRGSVGMVEFIEKERYYDDSTFTGQCWMYPTFMVKDGIEYFMWNRREPDDSWKLKERESQKAELLANDGAYFHFHGIYADPFEMLAEMEHRGHTFTEPDNLFVDCRERGGFVDFHGNRNEVSAAFHYRIYDKALIERIRTAVAPIVERSRKK